MKKACGQDASECDVDEHVHYERIALFMIENHGSETATVTLHWCSSWAQKLPEEWRIGVTDKNCNQLKTCSPPARFTVALLFYRE